MNEARRPDLAAMLFPLVQALIAIEKTILAKNDLSMWAYAVLVGLGDEQVRTQAALAAAIGADKSRLIPILDKLQDQGLISRRPDETDRRVRLVGVTVKGRKVRQRTQASIQRAEEQLLSPLEPADRQVLLQMVQVLYESVLTSPP